MISDRDILNGVVPADLDDKAEAAQLATRWGKRSVSIQAMLIASARRDYFGANLVEWVEWCEEHCGVKKGDRRSHLDAVGRMLLSLNTDKFRKYFNILFDMDSEKLIALQRLMIKDVSGEDNPGTLITFLQAFKEKLGEMSRDKLRQHVKLWLEKDDPAAEVKEKKTQSIQMVFPGFEKYLGQLSEYTLDTVPSLLKDSGTAANAGYGGYILLGGLVKAIRDGKKFLTAEDLQGLKGQLLDLVDQKTCRRKNRWKNRKKNCRKNRRKKKTCVNLIFCAVIGIWHFTTRNMLKMRVATVEDCRMLQSQTKMTAVRAKAIRSPHLP